MIIVWKYSTKVRFRGSQFLRVFGSRLFQSLPCFLQNLTAFSEVSLVWTAWLNKSLATGCLLILLHCILLSCIVFVPVKTQTRVMLLDFLFKVGGSEFSHFFYAIPLWSVIQWIRCYSLLWRRELAGCCSHRWTTPVHVSSAACTADWQRVGRSGVSRAALKKKGRCDVLKIN